jgi:hypothetical protein
MSHVFVWVWASLKIMHGGSCACKRQVDRVKLDHSETSASPHIGLSPAVGGWTVASDNRMQYGPALICNGKTLATVHFYVACRLTAIATLLSLRIMHRKEGAVLALFHVEDGLVAARTAKESDALVDLVESIFKSSKL